ncbi:MAG: MOSC domain-containing protein [Pseudomonadota bacterium]|nr:MOSC domain-containing protein [Pseudomonadota bacterium]
MKSCAPLAVESARLHWRGLEHDRRWMVTDPCGRFITGREESRLTLVRAIPDGDGLSLQAPGMAPLHVPAPATDDVVPVTVWKSGVLARPCAPQADAWLSEFLGKPVRLVHMDAGVHRPVNPEHARPGDEVSFADAFPLLLITQAALDGLNERLAQAVPIQRFRPNLVISGADAHAEDGWSRIRIGNAELEIGPPCVRCVFTTVDPERGQRDPSGEPLRTLIGYRRGADGVTFGRNVIPRGGTVLRVGDPVELFA